MQSRTPRRVLPSMLKALPVEVYPLVAVLSFAVMAGGTAGVHKLLTDPSLRRQGATGSFRHAREENTESVESKSGSVTASAIRDGWFHEYVASANGEAYLLKVKEVLHQEKTPYQDILVFESTNHGNVLVLDGIIQCTERDEFVYQETITHVPLFAHPNPKKVLVIGGGDGGVLREIVKHDLVEEVVLCEIDEAVIRVCKKYLPVMAVGFKHPKVKVHIGDGFEYMKRNTDTFDVIITDSNDCTGPAAILYQTNYYKLLHAALTETGMICNLGDSLWANQELVSNILTILRDIFPSVGLATALTPCYMTGQLSFIVCSKATEHDFTVPARAVPAEQEAKLFKYYNAGLHAACFAHPTFVRRMVRECLGATDVALFKKQ